jgi:hypothetical protein
MTPTKRSQVARALRAAADAIEAADYRNVRWATNGIEALRMFDHAKQARASCVKEAPGSDFYESWGVYVAVEVANDDDVLADPWEVKP